MDSAVDKLSLVPGNTWVYRQEVQRGPTVPQKVSEARTTIRLDSVTKRSDSTFLWTRWTDSATVPDTVYSYSVRYLLKDTGVMMPGKSGNLRPGGDVGRPLFMRNAMPGDSLYHVRYLGEGRLLSRWKFGVVGPGSYGHGNSLQGVGVLLSVSGAFGGHTRDRDEFQLVRFNEEAFSDSAISMVGPVGIKPFRPQGSVARLPGRGYAWSGTVRDLDGRILRNPGPGPR